MGTRVIWDGNGVPANGMEVFIHLSSCDSWVEHVVTGFHIEGHLDGDPAYHRIFVNVGPSHDSRSADNARLLKDVKPIDWREEDARA